MTIPLLLSHPLKSSDGPGESKHRGLAIFQHTSLHHMSGRGRIVPEAYESRLGQRQSRGKRYWKLRRLSRFVGTMAKQHDAPKTQGSIVCLDRPRASAGQAVSETILTVTTKSPFRIVETLPTMPGGSTLNLSGGNLFRSRITKTRDG